MNLGEIRQKFVEFSGRNDLVNSDDSDNGADFFINAGQRFLDRRIDFKKSTGRYFKELAASSWYLSVEGCRTLDMVWINDTEERWQLTRKDLEWLHAEYPEAISATDASDPLYWAPAELRGINIADMNSQGSFFNYVLRETEREGVSGLIILPPPDVAIVVELWGKFYSPKLAQNVDKSYWTEVVPETLLMAAMYRLELFYRNTEGAKDWLAGIELDLFDIDKDTVHEENINVGTLEG